MSGGSSVERWWFAPAPPERLGGLRAAIGAFALWYLWTRREILASGARADAALWEPVGVFRVLSAPMNPVAADWLVWITLAAGIPFVLGWCHRYAAPVFAVGLMLTLMYRNSWSMIYHMNNALVLHVMILAIAPSARAFSVDAWRDARRGVGTPGPADAFGWPIKLMIATLVATYFLSGFAKIVGPEGLAWARGAALREQIATDAIRKEVLEGHTMTVAHLLWDHLWVYTMVGVGTFVLELGAPAFMISRRSARLWAVATWGMHLGILVIMGIKFRYQLAFVAFLPLFHVEWAAHAARRAALAFRGSRRVPVGEGA